MRVALVESMYKIFTLETSERQRAVNDFWRANPQYINKLPSEVGYKIEQNLSVGEQGLILITKINKDAATRS